MTPTKNNLPVPVLEFESESRCSTQSKLMEPEHRGGQFNLLEWRRSYRRIGAPSGYGVIERGLSTLVATDGHEHSRQNAAACDHSSTLSQRPTFLGLERIRKLCAVIADNGAVSPVGLALGV